MQKHQELLDDATNTANTARLYRDDMRKLLLLVLDNQEGIAQDTYYHLERCFRKSGNQDIWNAQIPLTHGEAEIVIPVAMFGSVAVIGLWVANLNLIF